MTQIPFFSVIIPTRNRPDLFKDALQSVLLQDFDDFEVLVSDNSTDDNTQVTIEPFLNNSKLTVFRTDGNLSMPKHWEFITQKARGRYVLIVTDRSVLKQLALSTIHAAISSSVQEVLVCSWRWSLFDDDFSREYADFPMIKEGVIVNLTSQEIAQNFVNRHEGYPYDLPRTLNSCYRNDIATDIRNQHGALFFPISPDYTSAFLLLAHTEQVLFLDTALFISQGLSASNGGKCQGSMAATESYLNTLSISDYYSHVPIKKPLVESTIFEDFLAMRELAGGELSNVEMNWVEYFVRCYVEIIGKHSIEKEEFCSLQTAWQHALNAMDKDIHNNVKKRLEALWWLRFKATIERIAFIAPLIKFIRHLRKLVRFPKNPQPTTIIKVAGHCLND